MAESMDVIEVKNLVKLYQVFQKEPGLFGTIKSFFNRRYEQIRAVNGISFSLQEGELVGFIGPNGAGKTTTLKCLTGLLYPTSADKLSVLGFTPVQRKPQFLKSIAFVMGQKNQLWWDLPPMDTFYLNKEIYEISDSQFKKTLGELVELLDVGKILNIQVKRLSLGQRMKCELIAALLHLPKVLFLDEPTIGLDVVMQEKLREFVKNYNERYQSTIILTSHYMRDVQALARRVIIINHGRILFDGFLPSLIKRYAPFKLITLVLKNEVEKTELAKFGKIKNFDYPQVVLSVKSQDAKKITREILANLPVEDLNIEEADIEDVIRQVFIGNK